jgi:hypothetical protein
MAVRDACKPRKEVLKGDFDDAIFAADFGSLIAGKAPAVYGDATTFFENTHPAKSLCKVVQAVFARLAATKEGGATIRLSTGFGGGKTHTLMALWHLANNIADVSLGTDLLPAAGRPKQVKVVAVDAAKAGVPEFISHGKTKVHSLWGEIFYQLGGDAALKALGKADDPEASPNEGQIEKAFPKGPVLILLDELVIYMAKLSERGQGNLLGFLNSLASVVTLDDAVWVTRADSEHAATWTKEDAAPPPGKKGAEPGGGPPQPSPPQPGRVTPSTWEKVLEYAETRPLLELHLVAHSPADAAALISIAQPLGAEQLMLSVTTGGGLRDGGTMNFAANDVKPNHPAKPLTVAQTVYNSLADGGTFEADLKLAFGAAGRTGMKDLLQQSRDAAPAGVSVRATLDKPAEGEK